MAALTKIIQKASETEVIVKISGSDTVASVISLATDLLPYSNIVAGAGVATTSLVTTTLTGGSVTIASSSISGNTLTLGSSNAAVAIGQLVTGSGVTAGTYIVSGSGTSWLVNKPQVVASGSLTFGTDFATASHVNAKVYDSTGAYIGTITSVTNFTTATLTANAAVAITGGAYKISYATQVTSGSPAANIIGFQWAGEPGAIYRINRGGVRVATLLADNGNFMDFVELFPPEATGNTSDISVNILTAAGAAIQGEVWIRLRKVDGFSSKIETTTFGTYDNTLVQGS